MKQENSKNEACSTYSNGKRKYKQASAYILILNTGMSPREALALKNCDIYLENKKLHIHKTLKEVKKERELRKQKEESLNLAKQKPRPVRE